MEDSSWLTFNLFGVCIITQKEKKSYLKAWRNDSISKDRCTSIKTQDQIFSPYLKSYKWAVYICFWAPWRLGAWRWVCLAELPSSRSSEKNLSQKKNLALTSGLIYIHPHAPAHTSKHIHTKHMNAEIQTQKYTRKIYLYSEVRFSFSV